MVKTLVREGFYTIPPTLATDFIKWLLSFDRIKKLKFRGGIVYLRFPLPF
jgi:hypothetical protein